MTKIAVDKALIEQVLDALETYAKQYPHMWKGYLLDAEQTLRTALEQPAVEHGGLDDETRLGWDFWRIKDLEQKLASLPTRPAQPAVESIGGWQPIETAPRNGSLIVVKGFNYGDESLGCHHCIACWHGGAWMEASDWNATSELTRLTHWAQLPPDGAAPQPQQPSEVPQAGDPMAELEQENRLMRARMERLEAERTTLLEAVCTRIGQACGPRSVAEVAVRADFLK